ncbi:smoothelin-like [Watersipora subatra]|uniref:smoothelin-like n=1 Tax=Watersipora subatra TaxID=2589382 RepID=UPI00355B2448
MESWHSGITDDRRSFHLGFPDFPVKSVKGSVALLRSKFGDAATTDTSQIFGASPLSRSKTFHATSHSSSHTKYSSTPKLADSTVKSNKFERSPNFKRATDTVDKNIINEKKSEYSRKTLENNNSLTEVTQKLESPGLNNNHILPVDKGEKVKTAALEIIPRAAQPSRSTVEKNLINKDHDSVVPTSLLQPVQVSFVLDTGQKPISDQIDADISITHSSTDQSDSRLTDLNPHTSEQIAREEMERPLGEKYQHITDIEELNLKLKDTRNFEERRALRAAIRKLKDAPSGVPSQRKTNLSNQTTSDELSSDLDLSGYTTEEDLKILLHQTSKYEDKKRIRSAIREIRKKADNLKVANRELSENSSAVHNRSRPPSTSAHDSYQQVSSDDKCQQLSPRASNEEKIGSPPATPDTLSLLHQSQVEPSAKKSDDDVLVSPITHESKTLQRPDGDVQIERVSKHSRTTSHSDVYEKSTKVTKTSTVGDLSISEQDEIITKEKLSQKGSITTEAEIKHKLDISERNGSRRIEEDISIQKSSSSKTKGEESQSTLEVSIVREKLPLKVLHGLTDKSGIDGESLTWVCEFENSSEDTRIVWLKDGQIIKADKDLAIIWKNAKAKICIKELLYPDDTGCYTCMAKNKHGTAESSARLTVTEPPKVGQSLKFKTELVDKNAKDGDKEFVLRCELTEKEEEADVAWYKNGKLVKNNAEFKQKFDGSCATLTISEIFPEDSGEYECSVIKGPQEISTYAKVKVEDTKKEKITPSSVSKSTVTFSDKIESDANNNLSEDGETTNKLTNGEADTKETVVESSAVKCERALEAAAIKDDANSDKIKDSVTDVEEKKQGKAKDSDSSTPPSAITKPALKSVPKPNSMSRPTTDAEKTAESLVEKLSRPGTVGKVSVNQSWKGNVGGNAKVLNTSASKSWGRTAGMSPMLGKAAPGGSRGAMAAFKQMDTANNPNAAAAPKPKFGAAKGGQPSVVEGLLRWSQLMTKEYQNVKIENFSTSWNNGVAFLALIHHFYPDSFDWDKVDERRRKENFQLAFDLAEKKADIAPLLDVDDMVRMKKPDWKCVFTYVQSFYRKLRDHENNRHTYMQS